MREKERVFKYVDQKINNGMKKREKCDRDGLFSKEVGICEETFDDGSNEIFTAISVGKYVIGSKTCVQKLKIIF